MVGEGKGLDKEHGGWVPAVEAGVLEIQSHGSPMPRLLRTLQSVLVMVDGKSLHTDKAADFLEENFVIDIPAGLGEYVWRLSRAR